MNGFILIAKQMIDSDIWSKPATWIKLWLYILLNVNYQDNGKFKRGEGFFNFRRDCKKIDKDLTHDKIKKFLQWARGDLVNENGQDPTQTRHRPMISTTKSTRGIKIKVLNYDKYQSIKNYTSTTESTSHAPQKHHRSTTIPKEVKEYKEITNSTIVETANAEQVDNRNKDINWLIDEFQNIMSFKSSGTKDRFMAKHLLNNFSKEQLTAMLTYCSTNEYAPRIGSVEKLWYKRGDIIAGIKSLQSSKKIIQSL